MFNLYPYNYWLLYLAVVITIITLFLLLSKLVNLNKKIKLQKTEIQKIADKTKKINETINVINTEVKNLINKIKKLSPFIVLTYLFYKNYKDSEDRGVKRINTSLVNTVKKASVSNESRLIKAMRKI